MEGGAADADIEGYYYFGSTGWTKDDTFTTINMLSGNWTIMEGDVTEVNDAEQIITIGAGGGPAPHARLNQSFTLAPTSSVEQVSANITGTVTTSISNPATGDAVTSVQFVTVHLRYAQCLAVISLTELRVHHSHGQRKLVIQSELLHSLVHTV